MVYSVLAKSRIDVGVRIAVGTIIRYIVLVIGFIIVFQTVGIDLSTLTILAGALGIGIGFGLQNITNNFVSGIVILFERPIKVGDRIEVGEISGDVMKIAIRATTILTNDNISIIVPNSDFVSSKVINWSHIDRNVRLNFPVSVSYKEDPERIKKVLLDVVANNQGVLKEPKPDVLFEDFGESSLVFNLRVWTREYTNRPGVLKSQLYYAIFKKFREEKIQIPYPQRDIHIINE
jgi:small-conductance mechanosensitive channel